MAAVVVLLRLAWPDRGPDPPVPDDPAVAVYLDAVQEIEQVRDERVRELRTALSSTYGTRGAWLTALGDAAAAIQAENLEERVAELTPPAGYEPTHERWAGSYQDGASRLAAIRRAVERDDLLNAAAAVVAIQVDEMVVAAEAPPELCLRLTVAEQAQVAEVVCRDPETLPGGAYGRDLYAGLLRIRTEVFPRIETFPPAFTEAEMLAFLALIQPDVEQVFAEVAAEVEALDPPARFEADHAAVLVYLTGMGQVAAEITAAAAAGDADALEPLFLRSAEPGRLLDREVSPDGQELLAPVLPQ